MCFFIIRNTTTSWLCYIEVVHSEVVDILFVIQGRSPCSLNASPYRLFQISFLLRIYVLKEMFDIVIKYMKRLFLLPWWIEQLPQHCHFSWNHKGFNWVNKIAVCAWRWQSCVFKVNTRATDVKLRHQYYYRLRALLVLCSCYFVPSFSTSFVSCTRMFKIYDDTFLCFSLNFPFFALFHSYSLLPACSYFT